MLGRKPDVTPGRRIVLWNQDALRSLGELVRRKSGCRPRSLAKTACDAQARLQTGTAQFTSAISYKLFELEAEREEE